MRSSLMIGLSLRLAKSSFEGGAPSFFADRTGDTMCDDGLFIIVSVSRALAWVGVEVLRKKVVKKFSVCLRRQKTKLLDFVKKHFTSLFCRFKKSEQQQREMTREMTSKTNT